MRDSKNGIRKEEVCGGQSYPITYYIYFVVDKDGLWRIYSTERSEDREGR